MSSKQLICSICTVHVQSRCTSCISLNAKIFFIESKIHIYQNVATKNAHAGVCYLIKESSIEIHIQYMARWRFRKVYRYPWLFVVKTTHTTYICQFNYEYITLEYRQPSFINFQCVLRRQ